MGTEAGRGLVSRAGWEHGAAAGRGGRAGGRCGAVVSVWGWSGAGGVSVECAVVAEPAGGVVAGVAREKKTYWKLDYWAHARAQEALSYHERGFEQAGWTVEPARREGKEGNGKGGWRIWAKKDALEAEVYVWDRGSSEEQAVQVTVEEPRG